MSSEDIKKGTRWSPAIAKELAESRAAIFCLTLDNVDSPWLDFEAGAVSNTAWAANVCTYYWESPTPTSPVRFRIFNQRLQRAETPSSYSARLIRDRNSGVAQYL
ncbi:hypothetical protein [Occallatibacter savannae]|uniref:hypothetical protein n=1 Tax=Occallatibacter savannae TaxID=1002691 RepID=UPI000D68D541